MTVGTDGLPYVLVWASWAGKDAAPERRGLFILSFDSKGKYRSAAVEVPYEELLVRQFELFGSGDFLLVGHPAGESTLERLAILEGSGGALKDVPGWSGFPADSMPAFGSTQGGSTQGKTRPDYMVRGSDGRIYFAEQDPRLDDIVVFAVEPTGANGEAFRIRPRPRDQRLDGLKASGGKLAAIYHEQSPDGKSGRWWAAIFDATLGGEMQSLYGPLPRKPFCYQREGSEDRFTFLMAGQLVTMAP